MGGGYDAFVTKVNPTGTALLYSTLLGGSSYDYSYGIAVDVSGNAYVAGYTNSSNFPVTAGAYQTSLSGYEDAFVTKVNAAGTALVYSTHLGSNYTSASAVALDSSGNAYLTLSGTVPVTPGAYSSGCCSYLTKLNATGSALVYSAQFGNNLSGVAVDGSGNAYLAGYSSGSTLGTSGAYQPANAGGTDAVIAKLNPAGTALAFSTYLGGGGGDVGYAVALDTSGNAYVAGEAGSLDFPTLEAAKSAEGPYADLFVAKFNSAGTALVYSTFLGGAGYDSARSIAVDASGAAYVTGQTKSSDFPITPGAAQTIKGGGTGVFDAFLLKLSPAGKLFYSTYIGGSSDDYGNGVAVDSSGNAYVAGWTNSNDFFATTRIGNANSGIFVTKVNPAGSAFLYSTQLGGSNYSYASGIAIDSLGSAYVTGHTYSSDFPVTNGAYQMVGGNSYDAFVAKLNPAGSALSYATYLGGSSGDYGNAIAVDAAGSAYVTGYTQSADFPVTAGAYQKGLGGYTNAFVTKLNAAGTALAYSTYLGGSVSDYGQGIAVDAAGNAYVTGYTQSLNFPTTVGAVQPVKPDYLNQYSKAFVTKLDPLGTTLPYSTFFGGTNNSDIGYGIAVQPGYAVIAGSTYSTDLAGASLGFQKTIGNGAQNAFVAKISDPPAGCWYTLTPTTFSFGSSGGSGTVNIAAPAGCPWLAAPGWLAVLNSTVNGSITGTGPGSVSFTVPPDTYTYDNGSVGQLSVAGQAITVTQTAACTISLSPAGATYGPGGVASDALTVTGGSCNYSFFTTTPWIEMPAYSTGGNQTLSYQVLPNPGSAARTGVIYVGAQAFTVMQNGTGTVTATGIVSPTPGTTLLGKTVNFCWTAAVGADAYWLDVGKTVGVGDIYATGSTTATCAAAANLPVDGSVVYVQLYTHGGGVWLPPVRYTYTAAAFTVASLLAPTPGTVLPGTQAIFSWSPGIGVNNYWLDVGTSLGKGDLFGGSTTSLSVSVANLPCNGSKIYAQLFSQAAGQWLKPPQQYTYTACTTALANLSDPVPGSVFPHTTVTFKWVSAPGADQYWLDVGNSVGKGDIFGGATTTNALSVSPLPCDGRTIYVQLYTHLAGVWQTPNRYTYTACSDVRAKLTTPATGATLSGTSATFGWSAGGTGTTAYWLDVGNVIAQGDIFATSLSSATLSQTVVNVIPTDGRTIYVRLWTQLSGVWQVPLDYTFTALNDRGRMLSPAPGSQLSNPTTFCWKPPTIPPTDYWLDVGTAQGVGNIWAGTVLGSTCQTVTGLPSGNRPIWVRLWTRVGSGMGTYLTPIDYTYYGTN